MRKGSTNVQEINNYIIQKRAEIEKTSIDLKANYQNVTSSLIKTRIKGNKVLFFEYSDKKIEQLKRTLSYATRALNRGMRIEHVSKILDHSNISTTQIYAKIVNNELDKAMDMND